MTPAALTRSQFAKRYGLHVNTVDALRRRNEIKWYRLGRCIRILPLDEQKEADKRAK